jgi:hypothetical protein
MKSLILQSNGEKCIIEDLSSKCTLADVRQRIKEEFDEDMLPTAASDNKENDFFFLCNGVRLSRKQESRKRAWDCITADLHLKARNDKNMTAAVPKEEAFPEAKCVKLDATTPLLPRKLETETCQGETAATISPPEETTIKHAECDTTTTPDGNEEPQPLPVEEEPDFSFVPLHDEEDLASNAVLAHDDGDDPISEITTTNTSSSSTPHAKGEEAVAKSGKVLQDLSVLLQSNPDFCSNARHAEYQQDIQKFLASGQNLPQTIIGVLGNTGVGKSSLLNALLEEAAVLPTSGSRGCTAAVVELRFNKDLLNKTKSSSLVPVYCGKVEFIKLEDWGKELEVLVQECCTHDSKTVYARPPMADSQPDAAAAWSKLNQVYGQGTMETYHGKAQNFVHTKLWNDLRVRELLTPNNGLDHNTVLVEVGSINPCSQLAKEMLLPFSKQSRKTRQTKTRFATEFRKRINSYVYRKGNGDEPQTWPLIRVVKMTGPWPVLESGACLVDLPGVRDANAARAKVSQDYLQNCHQLWIVAPIQRAVDDGTARDLMGEQFKRRLLMDGQYGKLAFVCTQTDDCEATEILQDHADVAQQVPGRWERLLEMQETILTFEAQLHELEQDKDELLEAEAENSLRRVQKKKTDAQREVEKIEDKIEEVKQELWQEQRRLKSLCAQVRNEYSTACLQADFKSGFKELYRKDNDNDGIPSNGFANEEQASAALPDDFQLRVHCISSNDYLKLQGIKPSNDGPPNTFLTGDDTNIPALREFVHETTAEFHLSFAKTYVENASDLMDRVKLLATEAGDGSSAAARCLERAFEQQVKMLLTDKLEPVVQEFKDTVRLKVERQLKPSLKKGADKGAAAAMSIVHSWGDKSRRNRSERRPDMNGLYWSTYHATVRREGVYTSSAAGEIDLNQELCDPMEKEFSTDWQSTMDTAITAALAVVERNLMQLCTNTNQGIVGAFSKEGLVMQRLSIMSMTAMRRCLGYIRERFSGIKNTATERQRELNRSLLPVVQESMKHSYAASLAVSFGSGVFNRMKHAMITTTHSQVNHMFSSSTIILIKGIESLLGQLANAICLTAGSLRSQLYSVYSICWDGSKQNLAADPIQLQKTQECRVRLLPSLNALCEHQQGARAILGLKREEPEMELMEVETLEHSIQRRFAEAEQAGTLLNLASDDEVKSDETSLPFSSATCLFGKENQSPAASNSIATVQLKSEPKGHPSALFSAGVNQTVTFNNIIGALQVKPEPKGPTFSSNAAVCPSWRNIGSLSRYDVLNGMDSDNDEEFQKLLSCKVDFTSQSRSDNPHGK